MYFFRLPDHLHFDLPELSLLRARLVPDDALHLHPDPAPTGRGKAEQGAHRVTRVHHYIIKKGSGQ